jgi:hypothetical protein
MKATPFTRVFGGKKIIPNLLTHIVFIIIKKDPLIAITGYLT